MTTAPVLQAEVTYPTTGSAGPFAVPFPYLDKSHVKVYVDDVATLAYTWASAATILFNSIPVGSYILFRRETPTAPLVSIAAGTISPADVNTVATQSSYLSQEIQDQLAHAPRMMGSSMAPVGSVPSGLRASKFWANDSLGNPSFVDLSGVSTIVVANSLEVWVSKSVSLASADTAANILGAILVVDVNVALTGNLVLAAKEVHFRGGVITQGAFTLGLNSVTAGNVQIFSGAGLVTINTGLIVCKWFGAKGDNATNDTTALQRWLASVDAQVSGTGAGVGIAPTGTYKFNAPLPWTGTIVGAGASSTSFRAMAGFTGTYCFDFNAGTTGKRFQDLNIDLRDLGVGGTVTAFGSSSTFHAGGSSLGVFDNIMILSLSTGTYILQSIFGGGSETWMFTGAKFIGCQFIAPMLINTGVGDDLIFTDCRFNVLDGGTSGSSPISFGGSDVLIESSYVSSAITAAGADCALISYSGNLAINGLFIEAPSGTMPLCWTFQYGSGSVGVASFRRIETNYNMNNASLNMAFFRINIPAGATKNYGLRIEDIIPVSGAIPCPILFSVQCPNAGAGLGPALLHLTGCDYFSTFAKSGISSSANGNVVLNAFGDFNGKRLQHGFTMPAASTVFAGNGASIAVPATFP